MKRRDLCFLAMILGGVSLLAGSLTLPGLPTSARGVTATTRVTAAVDRA